MAESEKITECEKYMLEMVPDDDEREELLTIGATVNPEITRVLKIHLGTPSAPIAMYLETFQVILEFLKKMQRTANSFEINIANRLEIGFTDSFDSPDNNDMEKLGNFMFHMNHIPNDSVTDIADPKLKSVERCTMWEEENDIKSSEILAEIKKKASDRWANRLHMISISHEVVIPTFSIVHEYIVKHCSIKRAQEKTFEYRLNVAGFYDVFCRMMEDGEEISFKPGVYGKILLKDDGGASSKYD